MPDIAKVLKEEIQRLARKEVKAATDKLREDNVALKRAAAEQKRRIAGLEKEVQRLSAVATSRAKEAVEANGDDVMQPKMTGKMVRSLRGRLGLSQADFAQLLQVSPQTVYQWERKDGRLTFRGNSGIALLEVKALKAAEARGRLAELREPKGKAAARKKGK